MDKTSIISMPLDRCAEVIKSSFKKRRNTSYRITFHTHLSAFIEPNNLSKSGHWTSEYKNLTYTFIIPLSLLSNSSTSTLSLAVLDSKNPESLRAAQMFDFFNIPYFLVDIDDIDEFNTKYNNWESNRDLDKSKNKSEQIINPSERLVLKEISFALSLRMPPEESKLYKFPRSLADKQNNLLFDEYKARINIHPEFALSKIFTDVNELDERDFQFYNCSSVDFLVFRRRDKLDPINGGEPMFAVEFDGPAHHERRQQQKDQIKNKIFKQNNLPLLRIGIKGKSLEDKPENDINIFARYLIRALMRFQSVNSSERPDSISINEFIYNLAYDVAVGIKSLREARNEITERSNLSLSADFIIIPERSKDHGLHVRLDMTIRSIEYDLVLVEACQEKEVVRNRVTAENFFQYLDERHSTLTYLEVHRENLMGDPWDAIDPKEDTINSLSAPHNINENELKKLSYWYTVSDPIIIRSTENSTIEGSIEYSPKNKTQEIQKVHIGPFDIRVIADKENCKFFSSLQKEAMKLMLINTVIKRISDLKR